MPFRNKGYDPETIAVLQSCLDAALETACQVTGALPNEDLKQRLAIALMEVAEGGDLRRETLIEFALRSLPEFRRRVPS